MYKYFKELEDKSNFKTYLSKNEDESLLLRNVPMSEELSKRFSSLFSKINIIDKLITSLNENIVMNSIEYQKFSYDDLLTISNFFERVNESYLPTREEYRQFSNNLWTTYYMFTEINNSIYALILLFPNYKDFLTKTREEIDDALNIIKKQLKIILPSNEKKGEVIWPDAWYITPNGYLYNTGLGHKQGNLIYPLRYDIYDALIKGQPIKYTSNNEKIKQILERGYITDDELQYYSNLMYSLPTILTPELENHTNRIKSLLSLPEEELKDKKIIWPQTERSYQPHLITLIVGHLAAETCLFRSFAVLNNSEHKQELLHKILSLTSGELEDILVRFAGFHKVLSIEKNIIVTGSLTPNRDFKEYLDRGWIVDIVPRISYDHQRDTVEETDLNSMFISRHLEKEIDEYKGKGKILIYKYKEKWTSYKH